MRLLVVEDEPKLGALIVRALLPAPWVILGRDVSSRAARLLVAPAMLILIGIATQKTVAIRTRLRDQG